MEAEEDKEEEDRSLVWSSVSYGSCVLGLQRWLCYRYLEEEGGVYSSLKRFVTTNKTGHQGKSLWSRAVDTRAETQPEQVKSHRDGQLSPCPRSNILSAEKQQKLLLTLCLDERFCNLSFGCLNSFVFICPGSQKPDPLITAWLLCEGDRRHRRPFYASDKFVMNFQRQKVMLSCLSSPTSNPPGRLLWQRVFRCGCLWIFPCVSFIYAVPERGPRSGTERWVSSGGVTESGAQDSSLSFLNRLSAGKAMADAPHGLVSGYKPSGCTKQLHAYSRGVGHMDPTQSSTHCWSQWMNPGGSTLEEQKQPNRDTDSFSRKCPWLSARRTSRFCVL